MNISLYYFILAVIKTHPCSVYAEVVIILRSFRFVLELLIDFREGRQMGRKPTFAVLMSLILGGVTDQREPSLVLSVFKDESVRWR